MKTIHNLIIVAHPDDEVLGCGATAAKLIEQGEKVRAVILCSKAKARRNSPKSEQLVDNIFKASKILGFQEPILGNYENLSFNKYTHLEIVQFIEKTLPKNGQLRIFTHHPGDLNDDHSVCTQTTLAASRFYQRVSSSCKLIEILLMEIQSSTDWSYPQIKTPFIPNKFYCIKKYLNKKISALNQYSDVIRPYPHPRNETGVRALSMVRGMQSGLEYAEAFHSVYNVNY